MEGTLAPRVAAPVTAPGFREYGGGGELVLGRPRLLRRGIAVGACFAGLGLFMLVLVVMVGANMNPGGVIGFEGSGLMFLAFSALFIGVSVMNAGLWILRADEQGVQLMRGRRRPKEVPWDRVRKVLFGPTPIATGRYGATLGDAISIHTRRAGGPVIVDTVRFPVSADEMDRMASVLREIAGRHGIKAEPFPMAGRGGH